MPRGQLYRASQLQVDDLGRIDLKLLHAFYHSGGGHAVAYAHRLQAVVPAVSIQPVHQLGHQNRPGGAQRMTMGDRPSVGVDPFKIGSKFMLPGENDRSKSLIDLDDVHSIER
jgi:hypothetical protein